MYPNVLPQDLASASPQGQLQVRIPHGEKLECRQPDPPGYMQDTMQRIVSSWWRAIGAPGWRAGPGCFPCRDPETAPIESGAQPGEARASSGRLPARCPYMPASPSCFWSCLPADTGSPRNSGSFAVAARVACRTFLTASAVSSTAAGTARCREEGMPWPHRTEDTIDRVRTHHRIKLSDATEDTLVFDGTDVPVQHPVDYSGSGTTCIPSFGTSRR